MLSLEYVAGFFDGEGCVNLTVTGGSRNVALRIMIVNTEPTILAALHAQFGGRLSTRKNGPEHWKAFRCLTMTGHVAAAFLTDIAPYVRVKAAQVALGLEFWDYNQRPKSERCDFKIHRHGASNRLKDSVIATEQEFKQRLHELNKKGISA